MHGFTSSDLFPPMRDRPSCAALVACLDRLDDEADEADEADDPVWDCAAPRDDIEAASAAAALRAHRRAAAVARYLGSVVGSDLAWLDDDARERVWTAASRRLAERCGRTAMGDRTRRWALPDESVDLVLREPALVGDDLGLKTWGTAYVMARLLPALAASCLHHLRLTGLPVLELGAGTGLLGLAAAVLWGADVLLTDLAAIVPNLTANVARNAAAVAARGGHARAAVLQWGGDRHRPDEADPLFAGPAPSRFPLVLAADPLYDDVHVSLLADAIDAQLAPPGIARALVMVPLRDRHTERMAQAFVAGMAGRGLAVAAEGHTAGTDSDWGTAGASSFVCAWWAFRRED